MAALRLLDVFMLVVGMLALRTMAQDPPPVTLPGTATQVTGVYVPYSESEVLNEDTIFQAFLGIPFAEPPVGDLRFRRPMKKGDLGPTYLANMDKSVCPQKSSMENMTMAMGEPSEDCLYLGVFTPSPRPANVSVMVWFHGGAYVGGSGSKAGYKPYPLLALSPDIIVVTVNYRLGVLGFLTTADEASPGNYGMYDQVMALEWVQENIEAFGGDPWRVTIMGESAGASSVGLHLLSPLSKGLFSQAIMESGNALCPWAIDMNMKRQIGITMEVAHWVNCTDGMPDMMPDKPWPGMMPMDDEPMMIAGGYGHGPMMDCLRNASVMSLLYAQHQVFKKHMGIGLPFTPVIDKHFLPNFPMAIIKEGKMHSVPTLLGTNKDEGTFIAMQAFPEHMMEPNAPIMTLDQFHEILPSYLYHTTPMMEAAVTQWYIDWTLADDPSASQFANFVDVLTDEMFACPTEGMVRALEMSNASVYRYEMTHGSDMSVMGEVPGWMGAGHGAEIPFVFAWGLNPLTSDWVEHTTQEKEMSVEFMRYWTNFIKTGNPNLPLANGAYPDWPRYTLPEQEYKMLSMTMENGRALRMDACAFWNKYLPILYKNGASQDKMYMDWKMHYENWRDVAMKEWHEAFMAYKEDAGCPKPTGPP